MTARSLAVSVPLGALLPILALATGALSIEPPPAPAVERDEIALPAQDTCGDGRCQPPDDCRSCPQDCGDCCGDGRCAPPEDCRSCSQDCGSCCGDGRCAPPEDCNSCDRDCGRCR